MLGRPSPYLGRTSVFGKGTALGELLAGSDPRERMGRGPVPGLYFQPELCCLHEGGDAGDRVGRPLSRPSPGTPSSLPQNGAGRWPSNMGGLGYLTL